MATLLRNLHSSSSSSAPPTKPWRSSKRKARRVSKGSKPAAGTLVPADGEEMILAPRGKIALSKKLVEKILPLERRDLPHVADILDDDNPNPSEAEKALRKCVIDLDRYNKKREDKLAECQDVIRRLRHGKGYAVVDNRLEFRAAPCARLAVSFCSLAMSPI
uniref:Uncharacterized protein n=1 Tax=Oryza punctata TaxID=4537 RepID=A0A0E0MH78_ORYPU